MPTGPQLQIKHLQHYHVMPNTEDDEIRVLISSYGEWIAAAQAATMLSEMPGLVVDELDQFDGDGRFRCPECGEALADMPEDDRDAHLVRSGYVLIGCEGYYTRTFVNAFRAHIRRHRTSPCNSVAYPNPPGLQGFAPGDRIATRIDAVRAGPFGPRPTGVRGTVWVVSADGEDLEVAWDADDHGGPYDDEIEACLVQHLQPFED